MGGDLLKQEMLLPSLLVILGFPGEIMLSPVSLSKPPVRGPGVAVPAWLSHK